MGIRNFIIGIIALQILVAVSCKNGTWLCSDSSNEPMDSDAAVPFHEVLGNPKVYDGKEIILSGYFSYQFENVAIFTRISDMRKDNFSEAIWLNISYAFVVDNESLLEDLNGKHIAAKGILDLDGKGHLGSYMGTLHADCIRIKN